MQPKPEFRKSERFGHESIIKLEDNPTLSPYYAVSHNLSEAGMYFKSLFELYPGALIRIRVDAYTFGQSPVLAKVVWCKKLENTNIFNYGVGVEFLQPEKNFGLKPSPPNTPRMKTPNKKEGGMVIRMEKRVPK